MDKIAKLEIGEFYIELIDNNSKHEVNLYRNGNLQINVVCNTRKSAMKEFKKMSINIL